MTEQLTNEQVMYKLRFAYEEKIRNLRTEVDERQAIIKKTQLSLWSVCIELNKLRVEQSAQELNLPIDKVRVCPNCDKIDVFEQYNCEWRHENTCGGQGGNDTWFCHKYMN